MTVLLATSTGPTNGDGAWATDPSTADPEAADPRDTVRKERWRQGWRWGLLIAVLAMLVSVSTGGLFLYAAVVVGLLFGLSTAWTTISLSRLDVVRKLSATEIGCGGVIEAWLIVHNRKHIPASWLFWRDQIEPGLDVEGPSSCHTTLAGEEKRRLTYRLHSTRRGLFRVGPAMVEASGPFGLVRRFLLDHQTRFVTVLPRSVAIGRGWPLGHRPIHEQPRRRSLFEDPSRFQGIREYQQGDSLRRVHWRATARSGKLQVKLFEPAVLDGVLLAVEMGRSAYPDDPESGEELAVTAAASIVEFVLGGGQTVGLLSNGADAAERYAEDWTGGTFRRLDEALGASEAGRKITGFRPLVAEPGRGGRQLARLRTMLARLVPAPGPDLAELLASELPSLPRSLVLMIVTPRVDPALAATVGALERSGIEVGVVRIGGEKTGDEGTSEPHLLDRTPVYAIHHEGDLESLGLHRL